MRVVGTLTIFCELSPAIKVALGLLKKPLGSDMEFSTIKNVASSAGHKFFILY
jgi:hypothetical protein